jgi:dihydroflavonol-4-reductase
MSAAVRAGFVVCGRMVLRACSWLLAGESEWVWMAETVLVTGGTGYVAGWCITELLRRGYAVRTTVRGLAKESAVRRTVPDAGEALTVFAADLTADAGWDVAMAGCDYVLHVASPLGITRLKDPDELIVPAQDGTVRVLRAAIRAGVRRVVLTSSTAAATPPQGRQGSDHDETVWTDLEAGRIDAYRRSKVISERAAWRLFDDHQGATSLATVLPAAVLGPVLSIDNLGSVQAIDRLLNGMPGIPKLGMSIVDVRDVADLHIRAMTAPEAAGQRFIAVSEFMWLTEVAARLRGALGEQARRVPTRALPNIMVRAAALFDPALRAATPLLGRKYTHSADKARRLLGWNPRPAATTVVDCATSLLAHRSAQGTGKVR